METLELKESGLQILDKRETELRQLVSEYSGLKIDGVQDRDGYKKVDEGRKALKNARVSISKDAKDLRQSAVAFQKR